MAATGAGLQVAGRHDAADVGARGWRSRWSARSPPTSSSTPAWSPARSRCRRPHVRRDVAARFPVERGELHGGGHRRRAGGGGRAARRALDRGLLVAPIYLTYRTLRAVRRPPRGSEAAHRRDAPAAQETIAALEQARRRSARWRTRRNGSAIALADMTRLEEARNQLLEREQAARAGAEQANRLKDQFLADRLARTAHAAERHSRMGRHAVAPGARGRDCASARSADLRQRQAAGAAHRRPARRGAHHVRQTAARPHPRRSGRRHPRCPADRAAERGREAHSPLVRKRPWTPKVFGDRVRLQQVASNLLSNAVKFTPDGGGVDVRLRRVGDRGAACPTPVRGSRPNSCPGCSSRSGRPTARRPACTQDWDSACRSSRAWSRRTAERSTFTARAKAWAPRSWSRCPSRSGSGRQRRQAPATATSGRCSIAGGHPRAGHR